MKRTDKAWMYVAVGGLVGAAGAWVGGDPTAAGAVLRLVAAGTAGLGCLEAIGSVGEHIQDYRGDQA